MPEYTQTFQKMRDVGKYTTECLDLLANFIEAGMTTDDVNMFVKSYGDQNSLINAQYQYNFHGQVFPAYCCTSLNEVICHGIPSDKIIKEGDILKVDITFIKDGFHGDACRTYGMSPLSDKSNHLIDVAEVALSIGIQQVEPKQKIGNIGKAIEDYVKHNKMSIAKDYVGHGISTIFHTFPQISHFNDPHNRDSKLEMYPGLTFTIEPIVCLGRGKSKVKKDKWTTVTKDKSWSAQFEATLGVNENGCEIFCS